MLDEIPRYAHLIAGVHVSDWREPTRGWADRVLPGDGAADLPAILGVLDDVGWEGFYDLEIFSDNGTFGSAYPDSLWDLDAADLARRGRDAFIHIWSKRRVPAEAAWPERRTMRVSKGARWALVIVGGCGARLRRGCGGSHSFDGREGADRHRLGARQHRRRWLRSTARHSPRRRSR